MPTTRRRHAITETDEIAAALDAAARRWPDLADDRAALLRRLVVEGGADAASAVEERIAERLAALERSAGAATGMYAPDERERLRAEWPA